MTHLRLPFTSLSADIYSGFMRAGKALDGSTLGTAMIELIYLRVSQINGCAFCLAMHSKSLRAAGVAQDKLDTLTGWRLSTSFDAKERAALAWAESLTHIAERGAPDALFDALKTHFSDVEISDLTLAIAHMNALNRVAIGFNL